MADMNTPDAMAEPTSATGTPMPLSCSLCPKKPDFSDLSHLLTHLDSKGHLAAKHKMEMATNPQSKRTLDTFNEWYRIWDVKTLLQERAAQKKRKTITGAAAPRRTNSGVSVASVAATRRTTTLNRSFSNDTPVVTDLAGRRARLAQQQAQALLDPQLDRRIKIENFSRPATPAELFAHERAPSSRNSTFSTQTFRTGRTQSDAPYEPSASHFTTPSTDSRDYESYNRHRPMPSISSYIGPQDENWDAMVNDPAKLKGTVFDGMGVFDSATPQARRQRNQKKDESVLDRLKTTSESIKPIEQTTDIEGILRRERTITGEPEDTDSHISGESTPEPDTPPPRKKQRGRKPRQPLALRDANSGRVVAGRESSRLTQRQGRSSRRPYYTDAVDEDDDDLTYERETRPNRRRNRISVHRDNTGPDITLDTSLDDQPFTSMGTLTSSLRTPVPITHSLHPHGHQTFNGYGQQPYSTGYHGNAPGHHRLPSLSLTAPAGFRPNADFQPLPPMNLGGTFGSLGTINGIFPTNTFHHQNYSFSMANNHVNSYGYGGQFDGASFPHPYSQFDALPPTTHHGYAGPGAGGHVGAFSAPRQNNNNNNANAWDGFNGMHTDFSMIGGGGTDGTANGLWNDLATTTTTNNNNNSNNNNNTPVFYTGAQQEVLPEQELEEEQDDNATISPPPSEHRD